MSYKKFIYFLLLDKVSVWLSDVWEWFDDLMMEQILLLVLGDLLFLNQFIVSKSSLN